MIWGKLGDKLRPLRGIHGSLKNVLCQILFFKNFADFGVLLFKSAISPVSADKRTYFTVALVKKISVSKYRACKTGVSPV